MCRLQSIGDIFDRVWMAALSSRRLLHSCLHIRIHILYCQLPTVNPNLVRGWEAWRREGDSVQGTKMSKRRSVSSTLHTPWCLALLLLNIFSCPSASLLGKGMLPLHDTRGKTSPFYTTRRTRKWFYVLAAILLSGILVIHRSAPNEWRAVAKEKFRVVQGPFWPGGRPQTIWDERAQCVKDAFIGAYGHYQEYAFGADELFPLTNRPRNKYAQITLYST